MLTEHYTWEVRRKEMNQLVSAHALVGYDAVTPPSAPHRPPCLTPAVPHPQTTYHLKAIY